MLDMPQCSDYSHRAQVNKKSLLTSRQMICRSECVFLGWKEPQLTNDTTSGGWQRNTHIPQIEFQIMHHILLTECQTLEIRNQNQMGVDLRYSSSEMTWLVVLLYADVYYPTEMKGESRLKWPCKLEAKALWCCDLREILNSGWPGISIWSPGLASVLQRQFTRQQSTELEL